MTNQSSKISKQMNYAASLAALLYHFCFDFTLLCMLASTDASYPTSRYTVLYKKFTVGNLNLSLSSLTNIKTILLNLRFLLKSVTVERICLVFNFVERNFCRICQTFLVVKLC
uniref:Uncharacterized protein n=1 Tax=Clytia hemisphaerica TaxID=252671 RepID=A0A7M5WU30_9CNID